MRRRDTLIVLAAALLIALLAWFFFAREKSDAPTTPLPPGMSVQQFAPMAAYFSLNDDLLART